MLILARLRVRILTHRCELCPRRLKLLLALGECLADRFELFQRFRVPRVLLLLEGLDLGTQPIRDLLLALQLLFGFTQCAVRLAQLLLVALA